MKDNFDMNMFKEFSEIRVYITRNSYRSNIIAEKSKEYVSYLNRIDNMINNKLNKEKIHKQIRDCEVVSSEIHTYTLKVLIEKYGIVDVLSEDVRKNKLLIFFSSQRIY